MSKRYEIAQRVKAALIQAFPDYVVTYWRDPAAVRQKQIDVRDVSVKVEKVNFQHQHDVVVTINSVVLPGNGTELGLAMNDYFDKLVKTLGDRSLLSGINETAMPNLIGSTFDPFGDGAEVGIVEVQLLFSYRVTAWSGT